MTWLHSSDEQISRHLDGMMDPRGQARLEQHLAGCDFCRLRLEAFRQVRSELQALPSLEEAAFPEPAVPTFIPVPQPVFSLRAVAVGATISGVLVAGLVAWQTLVPPAKIISGAGSAVGSDGMLTDRIRSGASVQTLVSEHIDLELPNNVLIRMRPGTTLTWQQIQPAPWLFAAKPRTVVNVMHGEILARTDEGFWKSKLEIRTPNANATVKGTAFSVEADPIGVVTTVKVLAGRVFLSPYLGQVGVDVEAGQVSRIQKTQRLPKIPVALSTQERQSLLEAYEIGGREPIVALVLGAGPERVEELFQPTLLYLSERAGHPLQQLFRKYVDRLNAALLAEGTQSEAQQDLRILEQSFKGLTDAEMSVPLRLYVGAYWAHLGNPQRAQFHFRQAVEQAPEHPLASLGWAAIGRLAQRELRDDQAAREAFRKILSHYPHSPEAGIAKAFFEAKR